MGRGGCNINVTIKRGHGARYVKELSWARAESVSPEEPRGDKRWLVPFGRPKSCLIVVGARAVPF